MQDQPSTVALSRQVANLQSAIDAQVHLLQKLVATLEGRTATPELDGDIGETAKRRRSKKPNHVPALSNGSVVLWEADEPLPKHEESDEAPASPAIASRNSRTKFSEKGKGRDGTKSIGNGDAAL